MRKLLDAFRNSKGWFGVPPTELLARIARPAISVAPPSSTVAPNHDDPSLMDSSLEVHLLGDELPEAAEATAPTAEAAQQQAALNMVHALEKRILTALREGASLPFLFHALPFSIQEHAVSWGNTERAAGIVVFWQYWAVGHHARRCAGTAIMPGQDVKRRRVEPGTEPLNVRVLQRGDGGVAVPGVLINFDYRCIATI